MPQTTSTTITSWLVRLTYCPRRREARKLFVVRRRRRHNVTHIQMHLLLAFRPSAPSSLSLSSSSCHTASVSVSVCLLSLSLSLSLSSVCWCGCRVCVWYWLYVRASVVFFRSSVFSLCRTPTASLPAAARRGRCVSSVVAV